MRILELFLDLKRHYYAEVSRKAKLTRPRTLRTLRLLEKKGIFITKEEANAKYYSLADSPKTRSVLSQVEYNRAEAFLGRNRTLKRALDMLAGKFGNALIIVIFGSYVKGYAVESSDIDILLIKEKFSKPEIKKIEDLSDIISGRTGLGISCHLMNLEEFPKNELSKEVIKAHILVEGGELFYKMVLQ